MRMAGFEPAHLATQEPKSCVSANSTTSAFLIHKDTAVNVFDFTKLP